jgi:hypothetical protein
MQKTLQTYLRRLTNLSGNNRSLMMLRLVSDQFVDVHAFNFALDKPSFHLIEGLIHRDRDMHLCAAMDPRDTSSNTLSRQLKKLQRIDNFIFEERGAKDLYVGWPFIQGKFSDGTLVRCPLIFFPVELQLKGNEWHLLRRQDVNTTLNKTFLLAYSYFNQIKLDEELIEQVLDDYDKDTTSFRTQLYNLLKTSNLEINFNQEIFSDELKSFRDFHKSEFDEREKSGGLKLMPEAVLGIFPQAGSYLVPDYLHLIEHVEGDMESVFFQIAQLPNGNQNVKEENTFTPFRLDVWQEEALKRVKLGNSLVIQGPPGSGKSQLICNLISDYIGRGKNVLVVCQKRAALDVVYDRLKAKELHDFSGLVHDFKNDRKYIFDQIARQIDSLDDYKLRNNSLDAIYLERRFQQACRQIEQVVEELDEFKLALFNEDDCGKSAKELYLVSDPSESAVSLNLEYRSFPYSIVPEFELKLQRYFDYHVRFGISAHFWAQGLTFSKFSIGDFTKIKGFLNDMPAFNQFLGNRAKEFTAHPLDYEHIHYFLTKRTELGQLVENLDTEEVYEAFRLFVRHNPKDFTEEISRLETGIISCFKGAGPEMSLPFDQLGRFQESLERAIMARKGFFRWIRWKLTSKDKVFITRVLVANQLKSNKEGFDVLVERIDNRLNFEHFIQEIKDLPWLEKFPSSLRKLDVQEWFFSIKQAARAYQLRNDVRTLPEFIYSLDYPLGSYVARVKSLIQLLDEIPERTQPWRAYLTEGQIRLLLMGKQDIDEAIKLLSKDFDALVEFHIIRDSLSSDESSVVEKLIERFNSVSETLRLFHNSLALAWIEHMEAKYPILRAVSSQRIEHLTKELQESIREKRAVSKDILLLKSRERTYENVEYNRLQNRVTYRELHHQVTKKRRIWPIRRVISQHADEVFRLIPCWLVSPESASAIFPMDQLFDLVIFDEASQCFAERGIPAMYRGRQVVVVGDDMQLKPNDLYRVRWEEDEPDVPTDAEVDSLLQLAKKYIPEISLHGHYRSRAMALIEFSNKHFYKGKLDMLPHFEVANEKSPPIKYELVDGIWEENRNTREAERVAELIEELIKREQRVSIGVVTFNAVQQSEVLDILEARAVERKFPIPENLFVKNIENVQGDERDVIIFSTAYAPDKKGKLRLQFGSLNVDGGENRLNVAVTRARQAIFVVSSIQAPQLRTEDLRNPGPKLLKAYLEYAWQVSERKWQPEPRPETRPGSSWYLRNQLPGLCKEATLTKQLPFADLTLKSGSEYCGLVLTDDDLFYESASAKQAHAYLEFHLNEMKWPHIRFYSREFWIDRETMKARLENFGKRVTNN